MLVEKYLGKARKLYAAFMDLEETYDRVDREALWNVLKICGVGGQSVEGIMAFYRVASACVKTVGELSDCFAIVLQGGSAWTGRGGGLSAVAKNPRGTFLEGARRQSYK